MAEYIEREALKEVVTNLRFGNHLNKEAALNLMDRAIDNLPAADFYTEEDVRNAYTDGFSEGMAQGMKKAVVHARWVKDRDGDEYCENCSRYMPVREITGDPSANDYCHNCGAKMDAEAKEKPPYLGRRR